MIENNYKFNEFNKDINKNYSRDYHGKHYKLLKDKFLAQ